MDLLRRQNRVHNPSPYYRNVLTLSQGVVLDQVTNDGRKVRGRLKVAVERHKNRSDGVTIRAGVRYSMDSWTSQEDLEATQSKSVNFQGSVIAVYHFSIKWPYQSFMGVLQFALYVIDENGNYTLWDDNGTANYTIYQQERIPPKPHAGFQGLSSSSHCYSSKSHLPEQFDISKALLKYPNLMARWNHGSSCEQVTQCASGDSAITSSSTVDAPSTDVSFGAELVCDQHLIEDLLRGDRNELLRRGKISSLFQSAASMVMANYERKRPFSQIINYRNIPTDLVKMRGFAKLPHLLIHQPFTSNDSTCHDTAIDDHAEITTTTHPSSTGIIPMLEDRSAPQEVEACADSNSVLATDIVSNKKPQPDKFTEDQNQLDSQCSGDTCAAVTGFLLCKRKSFEERCEGRDFEFGNGADSILPRPKQAMSLTVKKAITSPIRKIKRFVRNRRSRSLDSS